MANAHGQNYFDEHLGVISALEENYTHAEEDFHMIQAIHDVYDHMKDLCRQKEIQASEIIQQLSEERNEAAKQARYPRGETEHHDAVVMLNRDLQAVKTDVSSLESQLNALEEQSQDIQVKLGEVQAMWDALVRGEKREPQLRNLISLYINITKVTWDLKSISSDNIIKGTIDNPDQGILEDICVDVVSTRVSKQAKFRAVNDLWQRLECL